MHIQITELLQKKWVIPTAVGVASFSSGLALGHIFTKRYFRSFDKETVLAPAQMSLFDTWQDVVEREMQEIDADPKLAAIRDRFAQVEEPIHLTEDPQEEEAQVVDISNIFAGSEDDWDYEVELSQRTGVDPYVIHADEFISGEMGYAQSTITYYAGDDIMADELDTPIYNHHGIMGELKFGHGSKDPNVVYIRNETMNHEWEILRSEGQFAIEVQGYQIEHGYEEQELKHTNSVPKFRRE